MIDHEVIYRMPLNDLPQVVVLVSKLELPVFGGALMIAPPFKLESMAE